jgi:hypothetical protein
LLLSNEKVNGAMKKVEEDEKVNRMLDPNYKNILRKKRIEQKKI